MFDLNSFLVKDIPHLIINPRIYENCLFNFYYNILHYRCHTRLCSKSRR